MKVPLWAEGLGWFSGGISFSQPVNTYSRSSFQVPGPDPMALGGQRLSVTAKPPCLSTSSDPSLPARGAGEQTGTQPHSPLIQSSCHSSLPPWEAGGLLLLCTSVSLPFFGLSLYHLLFSGVSLWTVSGYLSLLSSCLPLYP